MKLDIVTAPTEYPVSWDEAQKHLNLEGSTTKQALVERLIKVATSESENYTNRSFLTQTWDVFFDSFPEKRYIELPFPVLQSITHVKYKNSSNVLTTLTEDTDYEVDLKSKPGRVYVYHGKSSWPQTLVNGVNAVETRFVCGWGDTASAVASGKYAAKFECVKQAILLSVGDWFRYKEDNQPMQLYSLSRSSRWLLDSVKVTIRP